MKTIRTLVTMFVVLMAAIQPAWAVDTTRAYKSGILVLLFLGVCALIVVAQMVPALILMLGTISAFAKRVVARKQPAEAVAEREANQ